MNRRTQTPNSWRTNPAAFRVGTANRVPVRVQVRNRARVPTPQIHTAAPPPRRLQVQPGTATIAVRWTEAHAETTADTTASYKETPIPVWNQQLRRQRHWDSSGRLWWPPVMAARLLGGENGGWRRRVLHARNRGAILG